MPVSNLLKLLFLIVFTSSKITSLAQDTASVYILKHSFIDKDTSFSPRGIKWESRFFTKSKMEAYINMLPGNFQMQGYPLASVDSILFLDSTVTLYIFAGPEYKVVSLTPSGIDEKALAASGFREKNFQNKPFSIPQIAVMQHKLLKYYEDNGHPFASVYLDSISVSNGNMYALLKADPSLEYHIDSLRVFGKARLKPHFLKRYLELPDRSLYNGQKLKQVDKKISSLSFVKASQPSEITMLGSGALLDIYLEPRKNSQASVLIGFLPDAARSGKLLLSGDVLLDLKNSFGNGENILFKWQQLQRNSPRLNLGFALPYIFRSRFGIDFLFDLYKKDSSYLQVNGQLGLVYSTSASQSGKLIMQWQSTAILEGGIDTNAVRINKELPDIMDVSAVNAGLQYEFSRTDYKFNPRTGWEGDFVATVGIKKIRRSADIVAMKDPFFNYASLYDSIEEKGYQLRARAQIARFFPFAKQATFKWGINAGAYFSKDVFRNDLFQIGGFRTLRGFDEEGIFTDRYLINTAELRLLIGSNSYLFMFADAAWAKNSVTNNSNRFFGAGLGLVFETRLGLLNLSYAAGKRDDVVFNLREGSKLHFGYTNYF